MIEKAEFSKKLLNSEEARSEAALLRVSIAKKRIQSILDRDTVAHQKTLEQKIAEQGPRPQRVDPHLVGLAIMDLSENNRQTKHTHPSTGTTPWHSNPGTSIKAVENRLDELAPLYSSISGNGFGNLIGDALEVIVYKCLEETRKNNPRFAYQGQYYLDQPKTKDNRYRKTSPPKALNGKTSTKEADFFLFGYNVGPLLIECKNYREWIYPHHSLIKELIIKSNDYDTPPVLIARRLHYTTRTNLLEPAGIITHETLLQYYPADQASLAQLISHKRSLGFTDVTPIEIPHARTLAFFSKNLPALVDHMAQRWKSNLSALTEYAENRINLAELYSSIGSPAGGKWVPFKSEIPF